MTLEEYNNLDFKPVPTSLAEVGNFDSYGDWVKYAKREFRGLENVKEYRFCLDAKGRLCRRGADFTRARVEKCYPIKIYLMEVTL